MAAAPIIIGLIGAGVQAVSMIKQGQDASNAAAFNADRAQKNAVISRQQAGEDARSFRIFARKQLGDIRSAYGASGVTMEGSPQDVIENGAANAELDALKIIHGGEIKAQGFQSDATLDSAMARSSGQSGYLSAAGTLLSSGAKAYGNYYQGSSSYSNAISAHDAAYGD